MAAELRWILAALSLLLLAGIWWWGSRRSRQAPGDAELRESTVVTAPAAAAHEPGAGAEDAERAPDGWSVSPLEPLEIRTKEFEEVRLADLPLTPHLDPLEETLEMHAGERERAVGAFAGAPADEADTMFTQPPRVPTLRAADMVRQAAPRDTEAPEPVAQDPGEHEPTAVLPPPAQAADERESAPVATRVTTRVATRVATRVTNDSKTQRIVGVRVSAAGEARWSGAELLTALENHGLAFGRYGVFHRKHSDGRTLFCAASLVEPGTFDPARMPQERFRGLTLFAVLPGPVEPVQTFDALIETAHGLAATLEGVVQDSRAAPLTAEAAAALRDDIARFGASLDPG